jgi:hypothetical protein
VARTIIILGNHRNALTAARQLGQRYRVVLGNKGGVGQVHQSRLISETLSLPDSDSSDFPSALEALLISFEEQPVLFPIGDVDLSALLAVPSVRAGRVHAVMPTPRIVATCLDKAANLDLAAKLSIPQRAYRRVSRLADLRGAVRDVGCPCIIKSDHQLSLAFGKKAYPIEDECDLGEILQEQDEPQHGLIVQARAAGQRNNVYFAAESGRLKGAMEVRVNRTDVFDGSGYTVESESIPLDANRLRYTKLLIEALGYHGIGNTQFLVDAKGDSSFLEISPRMGAAIAVTVPCGFDFPGVGVDLARGCTPDPGSLPTEYPTGVRLAWTYGDLAGLARAILSSAIGVSEAGVWLWSAIRSAATADIHTTWSWTDPRPATATFLAAIRNGLGHRPWTQAPGKRSITH